ncbi:MAG: winged helix-turn-helix transcriptional regulator [Candidatus Pacebacteria bacterium]|nr:winged helix-turn-helix transcriptional regulator [Candidatus Paceibacterota bacterium]
MSELSYKRSTLKEMSWAQETASVFKILADPTRCKILKLLAKNEEGMCVGEIADFAGVTHSAASHQLNGLETRGVLHSVREGQSICYQISDSRLARNIVRILEIFFV